MFYIPYSVLHNHSSIQSFTAYLAKVNSWKTVQ